MAGELCELLCSTEQMHSLPITASAAVRSKGDIWLIADTYVFALDDIELAGEGAGCHDAEKAEFPKTNPLTINQGDRVYLNFTTQLITKTNTDRPVGWCRKDAGNTDNTVEICFHQELESATY